MKDNVNLIGEGESFCLYASLSHIKPTCLYSAGWSFTWPDED